MKVTIYELLGMIKDGKAPKKFIYDNQLFILDEEDNVYRSHLGNRFGAMYQLDIKLNDEVEIIEEEKKTKPLTKKDIEALGYACGEIQKCFTNGWTKSLENKSLEEEHKIPGKINDILRFDGLIPPVDVYKIWEQTIKNHNKINEILDYLEVNNGIMD